MKKVLEINVDDQGFGGVYSLVRNVILCNNTDTKIDIACIEEFENQENVDELNNAGTGIYYVGYKGNKIKKQFEITKNLIELIKENQYDCVHIHSDVAYKLYIYGNAAKKAQVNKIILHSHSSGTEGNFKEIKKIMHVSLRKKLKNIGTDFIACSQKAAEWMFPNVSNVKLIYNGIDLGKFRYREDIRKEIRGFYGIKEDEFLIGHVGRFSYPKNHEYLIRVFVDVLNSGIKAKLLLVGSGEYEKAIKQEIAENKLEEKVILAGNKNDVFKDYQAMDIFLLPSKFEGFPIVVVEALASGLPVIISNKVTKDFQMFKNVKYISIKNKNISDWTAAIKSVINVKREDNVKLLKEKNLDINDTLSSFIKLYQ